MNAGRLSHTLALAGRSIRADENRIWMHLLRGLVVVFLVVMLMVAVAEMGNNDAPGLVIYGFIAGINSVAVFLAAIAFFPSTITEEKEARTLGLLRMADIGPTAVIAGKALPRLCIIVAMLCVQIPIALLAVTLGGVTWQAVVRTFICLMVLSTVLCSLATLISTLAKSTRTAASTFVALLIATPLTISVGTLIAVLTLGERFLEAIFEPLMPWLLPLIPWMHMFEGFGSTAVWSPSFLYYTIVYLIVAGGFFFLSWMVFDQAEDSPAEAGGTRPIGLRLGGKARLSRGVWTKALAWKDFWFVGGGKVGFAIRMVAYPSVAAGLALINYPHDLSYLDEYLFWITAICLPVEIGVICSRLFRHDLDNYTWSSLMMLPKTLGGLVGEKALGATIVILPSLFWMLFSGMILNNEIISEIVREINREPEVAFGFLALFGTGVMAALMIVYLSLRTRYGAIPLTIVVCGIGWIIFGVTMEVLRVREPGGPFLFACFVLFVISVILVERIRNRLVLLASLDE